jgi:hypothetical protein
MVGLYACYHRWIHRGRPVATYVELTFTDVFDEGEGWDLAVQANGQPPIGKPVRPINKLVLGASLSGGEDWEDSDHVSCDPLTPDTFKARGATDGDWRTISLTVTPQGTSSAWGEGRWHRASLAAAEITRGLARSSLALPDSSTIHGVQAGYTPRGGVGLYVRDGVASFRNVRIIPLPEKESQE